MTRIALELASRDPARTASFLEQLFGWSFRAATWQGGPYQEAQIQVSSLRVGLVQQGLAGLHSLLSPVLVVTVDCALESVLEQVRTAGGQSVEGPVEVEGQGRFLCFEDPWGCRFGVWQPYGVTGASQ